MANRTTAAQRASRHSHIEQFEAELADLDKAKQTDWLAEGLQDATGYKLSLRQEVALEKVYLAGRWICDAVLEDEASAVIRDELRVFLSAAGLRGPHYKPPGGAHWFLQDMYEAYVSAKAWQRNAAIGKAREASQAAYHVGLFTAVVYFEACQPGTERDWNQKARAHRQRSRGGKAKAAKYPTHLYQPEVDRLVQNGLTYSSAMEIVKERFGVGKRHVWLAAFCEFVERMRKAKVMKRGRRHPLADAVARIDRYGDKIEDLGSVVAFWFRLDGEDDPRWLMLALDGDD